MYNAMNNQTPGNLTSRFMLNVSFRYHSHALIIVNEYLTIAEFRYGIP